MQKGITTIAFAGIVLLVVVILMAVFFFTRQEDEGQGPVVIAEPSTKDPGDSKVITIALLPQGDSGQSGQATLTTIGENTRIFLAVQGVPEGGRQPAHIHEGSCDDLGSVKYPLRIVRGQGSESVIDVELDQLLDELPLAINVHQSEEQLSVNVACGDLEDPKIELQIEGLAIGEGAEAVVGDILAVHYIGSLEDGTVFDSSYDREEPFVFQLGVGRVIRGWDLGIPAMRIGGKRKLVIPSELAYGEEGSPPAIPPNATLIFEVELISIQGKE